MAVKGLACNAQLPAKLADDRLPLSHRCHGQAQFGGSWDREAAQARAAQTIARVLLSGVHQAFFARGSLRVNRAPKSGLFSAHS
jgi:hypothetical protein